MIKVSIANKAIIDKEELLASCFFSKLWLAHKAMQLNNGSILLNRNQALVVIVTKQMNNALLQHRSRQMINLLPIMMQGKKYLRMRQCYTLKLVDDVTHLYRVA